MLSRSERSVTILGRASLGASLIALILAWLLLATPASAQAQTHIVRRGDTLYRIALKYGVTVDAIRIANGLRGNLIYVGQMLTIPRGNPTPPPGPTLTPPPPVTFTPVPTPIPPPPGGPVIHIVQPGESLYGLSRRYGVSVQAIQSANHLSGTIIHVGQRLIIPIGPPTPPPPVTPTPPGIPASARIWNISGRTQSLPLDCEARSAVDWAAYFGARLGEIEFFDRLPASDNPEKGFVGSVYGAWGQIPPHPYGVHAGPVAALLRVYGVAATAQRGTSWEAARAEIAAGRPVIVWITGHVSDGRAVWYTASDGDKTLVAPYEHTVIAIGYTPTTVTVLDGGQVYARSLSLFLRSWGVLGNLAITRE